MKTSELVVDITIVGFFAFCWISGFVFSYIFDPSIAIQILKSSSATIILAILLCIYSLGIIFDYINAGIFSYFKSSSEKTLYQNFSIVHVLAQNDKLYPFISDHYGRLRILRSVIISIPLLTWSSCCFLYFNHKGLTISIGCLLGIVISVGIVLFGLSIFSYKRRNDQYKKYITDLKTAYP